jgi:hypothetical protein
MKKPESDLKRIKYNKFPVSGHCDGNQFFNPSGANPKRF